MYSVAKGVPDDAARHRKQRFMFGFTKDMAGAEPETQASVAAEELRLLAEIARRANAGRGIADIINPVAEVMEQRFHSDRAAFYVVSPDKKSILRRLILQNGQSLESTAPESLPLTPDSGAIYRTVIRGKPFHLPRINRQWLAKYPGDAAMVDTFRVEWFVFIPLMIEGEPVGILMVTGPKPQRLSRSDLAFCERIGSQVAGAVRTIELVQRLGERSLELEQARVDAEVLAELARRSTSARRFEDVLEAIVILTNERYGCDMLLLSVVDPDRQNLHIRCAFQNGRAVEFEEVSGFPAKLRLRPEMGTLHRVIEEARTVYLPRGTPRLLAHASEFDRGLANKFNLQWIMHLPLVVDRQAIGALSLSGTTEKRVPRPSIEFIERIAAQVSGAVLSLERLNAAEAARHESQRLLAAITRDLDTARKVQFSLIPTEMPELDAYEVEAIYLPMAQVGGDLFDFVRFPNGRFGVFVADVSGHGVPAAMVASMAKLTLTVYSEFVSSPGQLLGYLSSALIGTAANHFLTCFYGIFDPSRGELTFANAGHPPIMVIRDQTILEHTAPGLPVGVREDQVYPDRTIKVEAGDQFLIYTDGIVEARNADGEEFGLGRLREFFARRKGAPLDLQLSEALSSAIEFLGRNEFDDDVTMVALRAK